MPLSPLKTHEKVRVAIVAPHYPEYTLRYAAALAEHADVTVVVDKSQCAAEYAGRRLPAGRHDAYFENFNGVSDLIRIWRIVTRTKPHVLHVQEAVGRKKALILLCMFLTAPRTTRLMMTVHDPRPHEGSDDRRARRFGFVKNYLRRRADVLVVHGEKCRALLPIHPDGHQTLFVSQHGVLLDDERRPREVGQTLKFLMFGRMEAYKGLIHLLEACRLLRDETFDFEVVIAGAGPELNRLEADFKQLAHVNIFNGFVPPQELMRLLGDAEAVFLPYTSATQSGVAAAAFGNNCYVVASSVGGLEDIVDDGDNGLLVPAADPVAIAAAVRRLAHDPQLRTRLLKGAARSADDRLSWAVIAQDMFERCIMPLCGRHS